MVTALQHGTWMDEESFKQTCIKEKEKRGGTQQPFYGSGLHAETGRRKVYAMEVFYLLHKNPMEAKEMIENGGGRKYANRQFSIKK